MATTSLPRLGTVLLPPVPDAEFRHFMRHWPTGVAIVTTAGEHGPVGCTVNALMSLSVEPPLLLVSLCVQSRTLEAHIGSVCAARLRNSPAHRLRATLVGAITGVSTLLSEVVTLSL